MFFQISCVILPRENVEHLHHLSYFIVLYGQSSSLTSVLWKPPICFSCLLCILECHIKESDIVYTFVSSFFHACYCIYYKSFFIAKWYCVHHKCLFILWLLGIWVVSHIWLLWIKFLWTFAYQFCFVENYFHFSWENYLALWLQGHMNLCI